MTDLMFYDEAPKIKIHVAVLHNPFNISERSLFQIDVPEGISLPEFLKQYVPIDEDKEYHASVNGRVYSEEDMPLRTLRDGDSVAICPVLKSGGNGKNPLAILAGLALSFFAFGVVASTVEEMFAGCSWAMQAGQIAAGLTMMIGGQLISNAFMPKLKQESDEPSYGWGTLRTIQSQGAVVPITYGTIRTAGQVLSQHVEIVEDEQYLNVLLSGGEGPIDTFSDIRVNDNPIDNFQDVEFHTREGTNTQALITGFNNLYSDDHFSYTLKYGEDWMTHEVTSDVAEGLVIDISFPSGLFRINDKGESKSTDVQLEIQYGMEIAGTVSSWQDWGLSNNGYITKMKKRPFVMSFKKDNVAPGKYHIRARCVRVSEDFEHSGGNGANQVVWSKASAVVYQQMMHPNKSLLAIKMRASEQLSGSAPSITWQQTRSKVYVFDNGQWVQKDAQNPAWIVYDLCVKARKLDNAIVVMGIAPDRMDLAQFKGWAAFCDRQVKGKTAIKMNLFVDSSKQLWEWIQSIATSARASIILKGTRISCAWDHKVEPVQLFSMGNIKAGSFSGEFMPVENRANAVEIAFLNEARNFERDQITVYLDNYDQLDENANPVAVELTGITDFETAYREGMYRLFQNKYLLRTLSFSADVDAIACQVGDVISIQHDIPQWGQGGRILEVNGTTLTLDNAVKRTSNARITIRLKDDTLIERSVTFLGAGEETSQISVSASGVSVGDVFALTTIDNPLKLFRILQMSRNGESQVALNCIEYNEDIYNDNFEIPPHGEGGGGGGGSKRNAVVSLAFYQTGDYGASGEWVPQLWASWSYTGTPPISYELAWSQDENGWEAPAQVMATSALCPIVRDLGSKYSIRVRALYSQASPSEWAFATFDEGFSNGFPPDPPTDLEAFGWAGYANLTWKNPANKDLSHIEVWESLENDLKTAKQVGEARGTSFIRMIGAGGKFYYWVRAVNYIGLKSEWNAEAGTECVIEPGSYDAILQEILKNPAVQAALEYLDEPIKEIEDLSALLASLVINNAKEEFENSMRDLFNQRISEKNAENAINGVISEDANYRHSLALIIEEGNRRESDGEAFAEKIDGVAVLIGDPANPGPDTVYGAVLDTKRALAKESEVTSQRIQEVLSVIGDPANPGPESVYAAIRKEEESRATLEEATTKQIETLASIIGDPNDPESGSVFATIYKEAGTLANEIKAEASERKTMQSKFNQSIAGIEEDQKTYSDDFKALSQTVTKTSAEVAGYSTKIEQVSKSVTGIGSQWSVKLETNGYISGLVMNNLGDNKTSTIFKTDVFMVGSPTGTGGAAQYPFVIGAVNGVQRVAMSNAFIQDLAVDTLKIKGRAVTFPVVSEGQWGGVVYKGDTYSAQETASIMSSDSLLESCMQGEPFVVFLNLGAYINSMSNDDMKIYFDIYDNNSTLLSRKILCDSTDMQFSYESFFIVNAPKSGTLRARITARLYSNAVNFSNYIRNLTWKYFLIHTKR